MDLNQACLVVDRRPLPAQPWQPDFTQGLYAETCHALLKSERMYPSNWSNDLLAEQFTGGSKLLSWDLMPDDIDRTVYLSPRHLGTVKASLRFTKPLPVTMTLLAYAKYDNLVVVNVYRRYSDLWLQCMMFGWQLQETLMREPSADRALFGVYTREEPWPLPLRFPAAYLINTAQSGTAGEHWVGVFLEDSQHTEYFDSYGTAPLESIYRRLRGMGYRDIHYSTKMLQGPFSRACKLYSFYFLALRSWVCPWGPSPLHSGNMT